MHEAVKVINLASASKDYVRKGKLKYCVSQLSRDGFKINLKISKYNSSNIFAHLNIASINSIIACVTEIGKDSYFYNWPATLPSSVVNTVVKSSFIKNDTNVCLNDFSKVYETILKDIQFQNHVQLVYADNVFGPTSLKRISVVLVDGDDKLNQFVQVFLPLHIGTMGFKDDQ